MYVHGTQDADGTVTRHISVHQLHADNPITAAGTPTRPRACRGRAADEAEQMDRYEIGPPDEYDERGEEL